MTVKESEMEAGLDYEAERDRRLAYHRNRIVKDTIRENRIELAITLSITIGFFVLMYVWNKYQPLRERAAYIEGYYGVSHMVAMQMAESEVK